MSIQESAGRTIMLNGEQVPLSIGSTVADLVQEIADDAGRDARGVAVERNGAIVPKTMHAATRLESGDRIEIVQFVGGG